MEYNTRATEQSMLRNLTGAIGVAVLFLVPHFASAQGQLRAGVAKTAVTPDLHNSKVYLAGFGHNRVATGVHDDLYVRCLALEAGGQIEVLCSVDVIGLFYDDVLKIREQVKVQAPEISHLIVASTHVHEGPDTLGLWGSTPLQTGIDESYLSWLDSQIAATAVTAARSVQPTRMELSRDEHPLLESLQSVDRPPIVKDPYLFVMRLISIGAGKTVALLVNWSDHPETLGEENSEITADYPHWLCQYVENHLGGTAIFFNGSIGKVSTLGNQVALQDPETGEIAQDRTWKKAELIGTRLGQLVERALKSAEAPRVNSILIRKSILFAPLQNDHFRMAEAAGVFAGRKPLYSDGRLDRSTVERELADTGRIRFSTGHEVQTEVDYVQLRSGNRIVAEIATIPGEIYPELTNGGVTRYPGADYPDAPFEPTLRAYLKSRYQFILGLGNDELGYLIPRAEWDDQPPWLLNRPQRWYGEINSAGPDVAGVVLRGLVRLIEQR
ncbi:MAG: hypothetical protein DMG39_21375 [Acidobacteria bacterium]|nr:MAG: hypothetical protein DMG39_21375 [Acidobacteriota bacterium]